MDTSSRGFLRLLLLAGIYTVSQWPPVSCQNTDRPIISQYEFSLDRPSDCRGQIKEIGTAIVSVSGKSSETVNEEVLHCVLTLSTFNYIQRMRFKLQFKEVYFKEPGDSLTVYDGEQGMASLWVFSSENPKPNSLLYDWTSGQLVTFELKRTRSSNQFDIRIVAEPEPYEYPTCFEDPTQSFCETTGLDHSPRLTTEELAVIIGGVVGLTLLVVGLLIVRCCWLHRRAQRKRDGRLGHVNKAASISSYNGTVTTDRGKSRAVWASDSSRNAPGPGRPQGTENESEYSVIGSRESLQNRPLPAVRTNRLGNRDRQRDYRDNRREREEDGYDSEDRFSERDPRERGYREKGYKLPTYREALQEESEMEIGHATEHSFVRADDRLGKPFVEHEMSPRSKARGRMLAAKKRAPSTDNDSDDDAEDPKTVSKSSGAGRDADEDSEEEEQTESEESAEEEEESEEEEEEESEDEEKQNNVPSNYNRDKSNTNPQQPPAVGAQPYPGQFQHAPYPGYLPPGVQHPQPRYGYPMTQHMQPHPYLQPQFTAPQGPTGQYPGYPQNAQPAPPGPAQPPVFSYLRTRGYQPMDDHYSDAGSTSTGASYLPLDNRNVANDDESDFTATLGSGVELMKRTTAI